MTAPTRDYTEGTAVGRALTVTVAVWLILLGLALAVTTPPLSGGTLAAALLILAGGALIGRVLHLAGGGRRG